MRSINIRRWLVVAVAGTVLAVDASAVADVPFRIGLPVGLAVAASVALIAWTLGRRRARPLPPGAGGDPSGDREPRAPLAPAGAAGAAIDEPTD